MLLPIAASLLLYAPAAYAQEPSGLDVATRRFVNGPSMTSLLGGAALIDLPLTRYGNRRNTTAMLSAISNVDVRLKATYAQIVAILPTAKEAAEQQVKMVNFNNILLFVINLLGGIFYTLTNTNNNLLDFGGIGASAQYETVAQILYGYGYSFPFLEELRFNRFECGLDDFLNVQRQYGFLVDMDRNYGFLHDFYHSGVEGGVYGGVGTGDPKELISNDNDPALLGYYVTEHSHALRRALYCIVRGSAQKVLDLDTLLSLYTQLLTERLDLTTAAMAAMKMEAEAAAANATMSNGSMDMAANNMPRFMQSQNSVK